MGETVKLEERRSKREQNKAKAALQKFLLKKKVGVKKNMLF